MKVSTSEENGILLYNQDEPIAMEIHQGHVRVTYNPGNQPATAIHRSTQTNTHTHTHTHAHTQTDTRTRMHTHKHTHTHTHTLHKLFYLMSLGDVRFYATMQHM